MPTRQQTNTLMKVDQFQIEKIEQAFRVKVLYACTTGSQSWGLESPYSDKDLCVIYHRSQDWYVSIFDHSDTIDLSIHTDYDGFGWDIKKILQGLLQSNAVIFDWLQSSQHYIGCPFAIKTLTEISQQCFDVRKVIFHYLGLGNNLIHKYKEKQDIQIKAYLLLIRSTLAALWVKEKGTPPPVLFSELLSIAETEPSALLPIHKIMMLKKQAKPDKYIPKIAVLDQFISDTRRACSTFAEPLNFEEDLPLAIAEKLFHDIIFQEVNREITFDRFLNLKSIK